MKILEIITLNKHIIKLIHEWSVKNIWSAWEFNTYINSPFAKPLPWAAIITAYQPYPGATGMLL